MLLRTRNQVICSFDKVKQKSKINSIGVQNPSMNCIVHKKFSVTCNVVSKMKHGRKLDFLVHKILVRIRHEMKFKLFIEVQTSMNWM